MEEPTQWEILRNLQRDVRLLVEANERTVSRELYAAHREAQARHDALQDERVKALEDGWAAVKRWAATTVLGPLLVAAIVYLVWGGKP